jgi:MoxR-like ATPase
MREIAQDVIANSPTRALVVSVRGSTIPPFNAGRQHAQFPLLVSIIARRRNIWLAGPAGSGKTSAAHAAARALSLAFGSISVGPQTTQSALFGYMDAHGNYIPTEFRRRFEQGGVFLIDEIDRGNPGVLTALNQAIENGTCAFPDAMIPRHPDFITVAAANTYGTGASREYVGALQLDAATLDRFVMLHWDYDEALETDIARATFTASGGTDSTIISRWLLKVRYARQRATALSIRHIVSPRASIVGADLLGSGLPESTVAPLVLWKGLDSDTIARLSRDSDD